MDEWRVNTTPQHNGLNFTPQNEFMPERTAYRALRSGWQNYLFVGQDKREPALKRILILLVVSYL
jgi:hypothetical protein